MLSTVMKWMRSEEKSKGVLNCRELLQKSVAGTEIPASKMPPSILFNYPAYAGIVLVCLENLAGEEEAAKIIRKAAGAAQTLAAFTGLDGRSVNILVRFTLPGGELPQNPAEIEKFHAHAFRQAGNYFRMQVGGCGDVRIRGCEDERHNVLIPTSSHPHIITSCHLSFDSSLYYNAEAVAVVLEQPLQMPKEETWEETKERDMDPLERMLPGYERNRRISLMYETSLHEAIMHFGRFADRDDKAFLVRLAENCCRSGVPEEDAVKWSTFHSNLAEHETEFRITIRNVYEMMDGKFGKKPCISSAQQLALQLEEFMHRRYELRRNEVKKEVEFRERSAYDYTFRPVTDEVLNSFSLQAHKEGLNFWDRDIKRYVYSDHIPVYNPIVSYLDHLPAWDGEDHIRQLARTVPTDNEKWPDFFYIWFLGMVAQWKQMNNMYASSVLPLLTGPQGCGKSTWCRRLMPKALADYYTDSLDFGSKRDAEATLSRFALICLDEFDSISEHQQPFLKHLLQKPLVNARRAYKSSIRALERYGVFIATSNNMDLLTDPTGNRRYLCIRITGQIDMTTVIDLDQAYAQAVEALRNGERYWFSKEDEQEIALENMMFEQVPIEEQLFETFYAPVAANDDSTGEWLLAIEIITRLQEKSKFKFRQVHVRHFGRLLSKNNIPMKRTNRGNCYHVKEVS